MSIFSSLASLSCMTIVLVSFLQGASGMGCDWGGGKKLCPGFFDAFEANYCCKHGDVGFCCNLEVFQKYGTNSKTALWIWLSVVLAALVVAGVVCCCCCIYRRKHRQVAVRLPAI